MDKISERKEKYDSDHSYANKNDKLLNNRERRNLQLRKDKIDQEIRKRRYEKYNKLKRECEKSKYEYIDITLSDPDMVILPEYLNDEFNMYDEKLEIIQKYLFSLDWANIPSTWDGSINIDVSYAKFALIKLWEMIVIWEEEPSLEKIDGIFFENLLKILFTTQDEKIQYKLLGIITNLLYHRNDLQDYVLTSEALEGLFRLFCSVNEAIVYQTIWIFSNVMEGEEIVNLIVEELPDFIERLNCLVALYSNILDDYEIFYELVWLTYKLIYKTKSCYTNQILCNLNTYIVAFEHEVNELSLKIENNSNVGFVRNETALKYLIDLINKITTQVCDVTLGRIIRSSLPQSIARLLSIYKFNYHNILIKILGQLCSIDCEDDTLYLIESTRVFELFERLVCDVLCQNDTDKEFFKQITWSLSNMVTGSDKQVLLFMSTKISNYLIIATNNDKSPDFIYELTYMFSTAISSATTSLGLLFTEQIIDLFVDIIKNTTNEKTTILCLEYFQSMLNYHNMAIFQNDSHYMKYKFKLNKLNFSEILKNIMDNDEEEIADRAQCILRTHYPHEINYMDTK
jgi:hypothetical protein